MDGFAHFEREWKGEKFQISDFRFQILDFRLGGFYYLFHYGFLVVSLCISPEHTRQIHKVTTTSIQQA